MQKISCILSCRAGDAGPLIAAFPVLEDPWMGCNDAYRLTVHMVLFIREISLFNFVTQQIMISLLFGGRYGYLLIGLALVGKMLLLGIILLLVSDIAMSE